MGFLGLREDAHLQLKRMRVKNMEGPQRRQVLRGGRRQGIANESQVIVLEEGLWGGLWRFVTTNKKEFEALRSQMPLALGDCVDPGKFMLEAISEEFMVDKRMERSDRGVQRRGVTEERMGGRGWGK
ncbi:hypothetical protein EV1_040624 [Malus domestica]